MPHPLKRRPESRTIAGRDLILGNGESIRKKARREYDQAKKKLEQARQEITRFENEDRPAFDVWMNRTFGQAIARLNQLAGVLQDKNLFILEVEQIAFSKEISLIEAYRLAAHRRAHPEETLPPKASPEAEAEFEKFAQDYADRRSNSPPPGLGSMDGDLKTGVNARVKDIYRTLVRKLHPDSQEQMTPQKLEWWHEVQEAYEEADLARLQQIATLCELQEDLNTVHTSVSRLHRLAAEFKTSLRAVRRELAGCRRDPAWNFIQSPDHLLIAKRIRAELETETSRLSQIITAAEDILQLWEREAAKTRPGSPRRRKRKTVGKGSFEEEQFLF